MMRRFFLLVAALGLTAVGTMSATGREPSQPPEWGTCKYYCGSHAYSTLSQCAAACGGPAACDQIC